MSDQQSHKSLDSDYRVDFRTADGQTPPRRRRAITSRSQARPKSFNGMHRRRSKKISW